MLGLAYGNHAKNYACSVVKHALQHYYYKLSQANVHLDKLCCFRNDLLHYKTSLLTFKLPFQAELKKVFYLILIPTFYVSAYDFDIMKQQMFCT